MFYHKLTTFTILSHTPFICFAHTGHITDKSQQFTSRRCRFVSRGKSTASACSSRVRKNLSSIPSPIKRDYKIGICCFSSKHTVSMSRLNNVLDRNMNNMLKWAIYLSLDLFPGETELKKYN